MRARRSGRRPAAAFAGGVALLLAAWNNLVVPRVPADRYVPVDVAATAALLAAARGSGLSWADLGLARDRVRPGLQWGVAAAAPVAAGLSVALAAPALRPLLADARVAGLDPADVAGQVLMRIPFGTVIWEEVAFRGVLTAALARVLPAQEAVLGLCWLRTRSGSLLAPVLLHLATNCLGLVAAVATKPVEPGRPA